MNSLQGFPIALFTLSLEKIAHILDGALAPGATPGQTELVQANEPGTLRQNLRDLKVADATVQFENLAREVGIDLIDLDRTVARAMRGTDRRRVP